MEDWRLTGQAKYLKGVNIVKKRYRPYSDKWDHDHCRFCWAKFSASDGDLSEGYATMDNYHWICQECYDDFKEAFEWRVMQIHDIDENVAQ